MSNIFNLGQNVKAFSSIDNNTKRNAQKRRKGKVIGIKNIRQRQLLFIRFKGTMGEWTECIDSMDVVSK